MAGPAVSGKCRMTGVAPYFVVDNVVTTAEYYRDTYGFSLGGYFGDPPCFAIVSRDDARIMFRQMASSGAAVPVRNANIMDEAFDAYIYASDVDQLATELRRLLADIVEGPVTRSYGMRELLVRDRNGIVIAFGQG